MLYTMMTSMISTKLDSLKFLQFIAPFSYNIALFRVRNVNDFAEMPTKFFKISLDSLALEELHKMLRITEV